MPFTFKISVRLALMKASSALALALVCTGCELPGRRVTDPNPPNVVQVVTSPVVVTLDPYQSQQFLAFGRTQAGDSVAIDVHWSATGGTITAGGSYSADSVFGDYQVTATATASLLSGTSQVKNRGPLMQVIVTPGAASLDVGSSLQFSAYAKRKNGDSVAVSVTYGATGGTVTRSTPTCAPPVPG